MIQAVAVTFRATSNASTENTSADGSTVVVRHTRRQTFARGIVTIFGGLGGGGKWDVRDIPSIATEIVSTAFCDDRLFKYNSCI